VHRLTKRPKRTPPHFQGIGEPRKRVLSLGAGVQSTVMALIASQGGFNKKPDIAIFADTGWEPRQVYDHLNWLEEQLTFPILRVKVKTSRHKRPRDNKGRFLPANLRDHLMAGVNSSGNSFITVPLYIRNLSGKLGLARRQCTREYKITPIQRAIRRDVLKLKPRQIIPKGDWVEQWLGISTDEIIRMKDNRDKWLLNRWPLIEAANMSREDCKAWFAEHYPGRHLPRSACIGCPLRAPADWVEMKKNDPESWKEAVAFDEALRTNKRKELFGGEMYLTNKRMPLKELVKLPLPKRKKDKSPSLLSECEGMCGV